MPIATILAILGLIAPFQDEPREIVAKLASAKASERAAAESRLEALGESAIPALVEATESTNLELRHLAASFLDRQEGRRLSQPTLVPLDYQSKPVREVADGIGRSAGVTIVIEPENDPRFRDKAITLQSDQPVPLWNAIDRLSTGAGLKLDPSTSPWVRQRQIFAMANGQPWRGRISTGLELVLRPEESNLTVPTSDSGAFRVSVANLMFDRTKNFVRSPENPGKPISVTQFSIGFQVRAEPRLTIASIEDSRLTEVVDDRGQSLLISASPPASRMPFRGMPEMNGNAPLVFPLKYPDAPGRVISRMKGSMRALVVGRRSDPIVVPLENSNGKSFSSGSLSLSVQSFRQGGPGRETTLDFSLDGVGGANGTQPVMNPIDPRAGLRPPPSALGQIEFLDAKGRVCHMADLGGFNGMFGAPNQRKIMFISSPSLGPAVEARYYGAVWSTVEIAFDFRDIPMP